MGSDVTILFPHQLFEHHPGFAAGRPVYLVEDSLFFGDSRHPVRFHKHKLMLHCATMEGFARELTQRGVEVTRVPYDPARTIEDELRELALRGFREIHLCDVVDDVLNRRIQRGARRGQLRLVWYASPAFLSPRGWLRDQMPEEKPPRLQQFYIAQRKRLGVMLESSDAAGADRPLGGRWSFDAENRKPWPARRPPPPEPEAAWNVLVHAAAERVDREFGSNPGATETFWYPVTRADARRWMEQFFRERLGEFGPFEDAICDRGRVLYHSVLTPVLNIGLITPGEVLDALNRHVPIGWRGSAPGTEAPPAGRVENKIPPELLPGVEGFVRQIIGWREYVRGVYEIFGVRQRNGNTWNHTGVLTQAWYSGDTGMPPLDTVIRRVVDYSYCHHIERLMVVGNVMLLCEVHPDQVYRWFMELFIDAYDWVMVPNVYGMSQFSDGGLLATKPYISGANYIRKMSNFPGGPWEEIWTGLFWNFLYKHREVFRKQPRMNMLVRQLEKKPEQMKLHRQNAQRFIRTITGAE